MAEVIVDARGRSCPEPVVLTKKALAKKESCYKILVDNRTAMENVSRFVKNAGLELSVSQDGEDYTLTATAK